MFDNLTDFFKQAGVYMLGKGLLTLGVFAAGAIGAATGIGVLIPAIVVGAGGLGLTVMRRLHSQALYEDGMVNLYRDNIADQLGVPPEEVTRADLKEAAKDNEIIAKALSRQRKKTILAIATSALAGVVSIALITAFGFDKTLQGIAGDTLSNALKPLAGFFGVGAVAGLSNLVLHEGLDAVIGYKSGISKAAAHDLIYKMDLEVKRGKPISREEVFAVMVAGDESLHNRIVKKYTKEYRDMTQGEKSRVLHDLNLATVMDKLAIAISEKKIRPGYLAYAADDPRLTAPRGAQQVDSLEPATGKPIRASFVERLGLAAHMNDASHVEHLAQQSQAATLTSPAR